MKLFAVIYLSMGISVRIEITTEPKHYNTTDRDEALEALAYKLGGTFLYVDMVEDE